MWPSFADDDVVVHGNAERLGDIDDRLCHLNIGVRRRRIAGRMIVHQDQRGRRQFERAFDHFARIDRGVIDGAGLLHLIGDELIALVEEQQPELLFILIGHRGAAIVDHAGPGRQHGALLHLAARDPARRCVHDLEFIDDGLDRRL